MARQRQGAGAEVVGCRDGRAAAIHGAGRLTGDHGAVGDRMETADWDGLAPIVAHGLLGPIAGIRGYAQILVARAGRLDPAEREMMLEQIMAIADLAAGMLTDMVRGLPPDVTHMLGELDAETHRRHGLEADPARDSATKRR